MNTSQPPITLIANTLKSERMRRSLSLAEVARQAKIAKSTLSQLENGVGNPSIETLWSICLVLDIPISRLLEEPKHEIKIIRCGEGTMLASKNNSYLATLLAACPSNVSRDIYWIHVEPGSVHTSEPHFQGTIEHMVVTKGKARVGLADKAHILYEGDYICYPADLPHIYEAIDETSCAVLISEYISK